MKTKDYKEMQKVKKKLNTLQYVFDAMNQDLEKMQTSEFPYNQTDEYKNLYDRMYDLFHNQMEIFSEEYIRLLNIVYRVEDA